MKIRQVLLPMAFVAACLALGLLTMELPGLYFGLYVALVTVIVVGFAVRIARYRRHPVRDGLAPAGDAAEAVQDLYLARPRVPVVYGDDTPDPDLTLYVDAPQQDPADLRDLPTGPASS